MRNASFGSQEAMVTMKKQPVCPELYQEMMMSQCPERGLEDVLAEKGRSVMTNAIEKLGRMRTEKCLRGT